MCVCVCVCVPVGHFGKHNWNSVNSAREREREEGLCASLS